MNTHEQYVSLQTSKLLKQAGFDWRVYGYYTDNDNLHIAILESDHNSEGFLSAPTQAVAQRWLREVKGIDTIIDYGADYELAYSYIPYRLDQKRNYMRSEGFLTYESALEAGLQKCLTLILEEKK